MNAHENSIKILGLIKTRFNPFLESSWKKIYKNSWKAFNHREIPHKSRENPMRTEALASQKKILTVKMLRITPQHGSSWYLIQWQTILKSLLPPSRILLGTFKSLATKLNFFCHSIRIEWNFSTFRVHFLTSTSTLKFLTARSAALDGVETVA